MNILIAFFIIIILYICLNKIYSTYWNKGLSVDIRFDEQLVTENDTAHITEIISNRNFLPIPALWVKFAADRSLLFKDRENISTSDKCYKNDIFSIFFYQKITKKLTFTAGRRGFFKIDKIDIVASNLIFSDSLVSSIPCDTTLMVYPRLTDTKRMSIPFKQIMGEITTAANRFAYDDPFLFAGIRPYIYGDSLKDINWNATARCGTLHTNVHDHTVRQEVCFLYNPELDGMLEDNELCEENIRIIATLATLFTDETGIGISFYTTAKDIITKEASCLCTGMGRGHLQNLFATLARLELSLPCDNFEQYVDTLINTHKINANATVILVTSKKGADMQHLFSSLNDSSRRNSNNISSFWLLPVYSSELKNVPAAPNIFPWEVRY